MLSSNNAAQQLFDDENNLIEVGNGKILSDQAITNGLNSQTLAAKTSSAAVKSLATAGTVGRNQL